MFEKDYYKSEKVIQPQCKKCMYFKINNGEVFCTKQKTIIQYLVNEKKCEFKIIDNEQ